MLVLNNFIKPKYFMSNTRHYIWRLIFIAALIFATIGSAVIGSVLAQSDTREIGAGGLPLPRFATLKSATVNLRQGPGTHFPRLWQYRRRHLPIEIIDEYGAWRRVRDQDGTSGWILASLLSGKRYVMLVATDTSHAVRRAPDAQSGIITFAESGALAQVLTCQDGWCALKFSTAYHNGKARQKSNWFAPATRGWLARDALWGVYDFEAQNFSASR